MFDLIIFTVPSEVPHRNWLIYRKVTQPTVGITNISTTIPSQYTLEQNYPNPFNPSTVIRFNLPSESVVTLKILNVIGQEVTTLVNGKMDAGMREVSFNVNGLASGLYFYSITVNGKTVTKSMVLMK